MGIYKPASITEEHIVTAQKTASTFLWLVIITKKHTLLPSKPYYVILNGWESAHVTRCTSIRNHLEMAHLQHSHTPNPTHRRLSKAVIVVGSSKLDREIRTAAEETKIPNIHCPGYAGAYIYIFPRSPKTSKSTSLRKVILKRVVAEDS
jgi:hypothetical protein